MCSICQPCVHSYARHLQAKCTAPPAPEVCCPRQGAASGSANHLQHGPSTTMPLKHHRCAHLRCACPGRELCTAAPSSLGGCHLCCPVLQDGWQRVTVACKCARTCPELMWQETALSPSDNPEYMQQVAVLKACRQGQSSGCNSFPCCTCKVQHHMIQLFPWSRLCPEATSESARSPADSQLTALCHQAVCPCMQKQPCQAAQYCF